MQQRLTSLAEKAKAEIEGATEPSRVEELRVKYLGKKGEVSAVLGGLGKMSPDERRALGEVANKVKAELESLLQSAARRAEDQQLEAELKGPKLDVTLPGRFRAQGKRH